jgi:hypothetical protein
MQFHSGSSCFLSLGSKYSAMQFVLKRPQSSFSLTVRHQVSHKYKKADKIIMLCILNFTFCKRRC